MAPHPQKKFRNSKNNHHFSPSIVPFKKKSPIISSSYFIKFSWHQYSKALKNRSETHRFSENLGGFLRFTHRIVLPWLPSSTVYGRQRQMRAQWKPPWGTWPRNPRTARIRGFVGRGITCYLLILLFFLALDGTLITNNWGDLKEPHIYIYMYYSSDAVLIHN